MCGLTGLYLSNNRSVEDRMLQRMTNSLAHRGPDDAGVWINDSIGLGHRRLSIIDLSQHAHQPMISRDDSIVLVFNGEIYNYRELKRELESMGVVFSSNSDTEVILEGYREWGDAILERLNGMFAIALVDVKNKHLLLARDRFGIKPLHYAFTKEGVVFGSEIKALLASGFVDKTIDDSAVAEYLHYSSALGTKTFFESIKNLEPGYALSFTPEKTKFFQFSNVTSVVQSTDNYETAVKSIYQLLDDSVKRQMIADVPIGVFLSGGVDSSAIAMLASQYSEQTLQTFSADFAFAEDQSELAMARLVAKKIGSKHEEIHIEPSDLQNTIETLVDAHGQPFGDAANIPIYLMCEALNGRVKVVLQGDGGDELFGGYPRYERLTKQRIYKLMALGLMPFRSFIPKSSKAYRALRSLNAMTFSAADEIMALIMSQEPFGDNPLQQLSKEFRERLATKDPFARYREMHNRFKTLDPAQAMMFTDVSVILPDVYFPKVDRSSMSSSIEVRVPMMDNELVSYALSLPNQKKLKSGEKKALLKASLRGIVPNQILDGQKKGFGVPVSLWLRGPLSSYMRDTFADNAIRHSGLFNDKELQRRINHHINGTADYGQSLYKMLNLAIWYRRYIS